MLMPQLMMTFGNFLKSPCLAPIRCYKGWFGLDSNQLKVLELLIGAPAPPPPPPPKPAVSKLKIPSSVVVTKPKVFCWIEIYYCIALDR